VNIGVEHWDLSLSTEEGGYMLEVSREPVFRSRRRKEIPRRTIAKPRGDKLTMLMGNIDSLIRWNQLRVVIREVPGGRSVKIYDGWKRVGALQIGPRSA
jgi:hypothetical protein